MEQVREGRAIKISELASELAVTPELVAKLMQEVHEVLAAASDAGLSDEALLWVLDDAAAALRGKLKLG